MRDVVRITCIFSSLSFIDTLFLYFRSCDHFFLHIVLIFFICGCMFLSPTPYMCCFFSLFIHRLLILVCNLLFLFHTKMS